MRNFAFWSILWLAASLLPSAQTQQHPFTIEDAASLRSAAAVAVAPDGKTILYRVRFGGPSGPDKVEWRLIPAGGGDSRKLSVPDSFEPSGFTRDGSALYGTFAVNKMAQLATLALAAPNTAAAAAATPVPLTSLPKGIHSAAISPDGSHYAILADPRLPDPLAEVHTVIEAEPTSLYVVGTDGSGGAWWCPTLSNMAEIAWSRDGASLAVLSQTPKIGFHYVRSFIDVCSPGGARHVATVDNATNGMGWIHGGTELVFLSTTTDVLTPDHVWTVPAGGGPAVDRTPKLEGSAEQLFVDARGNAWVLVAHGVRSDVEEFQNGALAAAYNWPDGTINNVITPALADSPEVRVFSVSDPQHPSNLAIAKGSGLERITNEGDEQLAKVAVGEVRAVRWTSQEGIPLEGIVTFPSNYQAGKKYPFLVMPHGGPEANDSLRFDIFSRAIAGMGYVVLQPEYRGSTGYGTEFLNAIYQHFGDRAYRDVDAATDYAISQGWADPNRLVVFGWSAGGFMTSWTVTQTHRYKAAIEGAGITDWLSFMWTSDVQQIDYDARWTDKDPNAFFAFSAMMHAADVTTPLLVLHGASDERVPTYQGREYFELLAARGKTTRMVTYPGSPHFPTVWEQRQDVFREIAAWLAKYNP
jgi:dipeptidyl aminopeptidase/acylaminoacyl peptidase